MTTDDKFAQTPPSPRPNYPEYFGNVRIAGDLLSSDGAKGWLRSVPNPSPQHRYVVWLGCQVLRTVHLVESLNDIFERLAVDQVSLGGPSNCCGIIHDKAGDTTIGDRLTRQTVEKFSALKPDQMLYWCPSCDNHLRSKGPDFETDLTRGRRSVIGLLSELLTPDRFVVNVPLRVAFHAHPGEPEQDADIEALRRILSRIPKLEIVELDQISGIGRHCSDGNVKSFGTDRHRAEMENWIRDARHAGADRVVSIYHSCHRYLIQYQVPKSADERIPVENYLTLICRGLGLPIREDKYAKFSMLNDAEKIFDELSERIERHRVNKDTALRVIRSQFITEL